MKTIKTKEVDNSIHVLDKHKGIEKSSKLSDIKTTDKKDTTKEKTNDPSKVAVNKVSSTEKNTVVSSVHYAKKYTKDKKVALQKIKNIESVLKEDKATDSSLKNKIKSKKDNAKERRVFNKFHKSNSEKIKQSYSQNMKHYSIRKKQKKMKEATQKTATATRKGLSFAGKSTKVAFKAVVKVVSSLGNLLSAGGSLIVLVVITLFLGIFASLSSDSGVETSTLPLSSEVIEYTDTIRKYAKENDIEDYISLLQAIMMQESGGKGNDPMQSSECEYNTKYPQKPNGIKEPEYSIQVGVKYFSDCIKESKPKDSYDMQKIYLALQGYNYGKGYINWAVTNFDGYTRANAKVYSDEMRAKLQVDAYGDPNYVNHVLQYYHVGNVDIVKVALTQIGNINGKPYWEWYGYTSRVEWCACFVSWCANEAGLLEKGIIPKFSYCPTGIKWFKEHNQWMARGQTPQTGYIIFFDWENDGISDHVGIVERVENGVIYTIEGNSNNECRRNTYSLNNIYIYMDSVDLIVKRHI